MRVEASEEGGGWGGRVFKEDGVVGTGGIIHLNGSGVVNCGHFRCLFRVPCCYWHIGEDGERFVDLRLTWY